MVKFTTASAKTRNKSRAFIPTVDVINQDKITQVFLNELFIYYLSFVHWTIMINVQVTNIFGNGNFGVFQLSQKYWASYSTEKHLPFEQSVVDDLYINDIVQSR